MDLKKALSLDPLCGVAWYNLAVATSNVKKQDRSFEWFITSILQTWDLESWVNALLLMIEDKVDLKDPTLSFSFIYQAVENFNGAIVPNVEKILKDQGLFDDNKISGIIKIFKGMLTNI